MSPIIYINKKAICHNVKIVRKLAPNCQIIAMVKANAYGHGLMQIFNCLKECHVKHFGVVEITEAVMLRKLGADGIILLTAAASWMGGVDDLFNYNLTPSISSLEELKIIYEACQKRNIAKFSVHMDIDTGMGRNGIVYHRNDKTKINSLIDFFLSQKIIVLQGISTHFADADNDCLQYTNYQLENFYSCLKYLFKHNLKPKIIHMNNSSAIMKRISLNQHKEFSHVQWMLRPGLMLYGLSNEQSNILKPVLSLKAPILLHKKIKKGQFISYGCSWQAKRDSDILVTGIGYGHGYNRLLSNKSNMLLHETKLPVIGKICMDMTMVDATDFVAEYGSNKCQAGKYLHVFGADSKNANLAIDAYELAKICGTIPYEILTSLSANIKRIII